MKGKIIRDKYQILKTLSGNFCSTTFLATDNRRLFPRRYIIKKFRPILGNPEAENTRQAFYQEAKTLKRLSGKNRQIPQLYEYFMDGEDFYLVREWIGGVNLKQRVEQHGTFSPEEVERILRSVLTFLQDIHSYGIVYRQLKPSNIILRQPNWLPASEKNCLPVPIYFGGVKDLETQVDHHQQHNRQYSLVGIHQREYIPPEQKRGRSVFASDLYSLGLTAIYLLTGKSPQAFPIDPQTQKVLWHQEIPELKIHLVRVIERAIYPTMRDRYGSAAEMLKALNSPPINIAMPVAQSEPKKFQFTGELKIISLLFSLGLGVAALTLIAVNTNLFKSAQNSDEQYRETSQTDKLMTDTLIPSSVSSSKQVGAVKPEISATPENSKTSRNSTIAKEFKTATTPLNIPPFPLGVTQQNLIQSLGEPTKNSQGYWSHSRALLYEGLSPDITLGYLTDTKTTQVRQAEISFASSVNLLTIKQQVKHLMQDNYSPAIDHYLNQIYFKTSYHHDFKINNIEGVIQKNSEDHLYISIWDRDFH